MSDRKVIAVVGATGAQGGGLVRAILNDSNGGFAARVPTRNVNGARAKDFARLGAEVAAADIDEPESLKKAFEGAYAAFCVTFFWAHFSPQKEIEEAKAMAAIGRREEEYDPGCRCYRPSRKRGLQKAQEAGRAGTCARSGDEFEKQN
jgi:uncharacterized protein YbjT (DUF2867 family)